MVRRIQYPSFSGTDHVFMSFGKAELAQEQDDSEILLSVYATDLTCFEQISVYYSKKETQR